MSTRETPPSTSRTSTPHSDEELDVVLRERYAERIRELARVPEQIQAAYRDAWQQYYVWEPAYCERTLRNLRTTDPSSAFALDDFLSDFGDLSDVDNSIEGEGNRVLYEQWIVDDDEVIYNAGAMEETSLPPCKDCAYPKYESCTPATRNIKHELDVRILQYMPYDDPSFLQHDLEEFARKHDVFAWQHSWYDVDFKLIALEAVYRLHSAGLSPEVLDQYSVDFFPSIDGSSGLSASMHHRDLLQWGDSYSSDSSAQVSALNKLRPSSASPHLGKSVDDMTTSFCASANCHEALCMLHRQRYPPFALDPATGNHKDLRRVTICGPNCFRSREAEKYPVSIAANANLNRD
ncbi:hypothetical protein BD310DRAFT_978363 [Dichomitus squalens]|uniref:Uncharacterized protein n=1 Tax=Dichomitus squalens TaxID=114155 RepID=A0A4Q9PS31_9APHY|nr:hypothetical protein BD310DRAFT_978363 [Dichomitus squalens]